MTYFSRRTSGGKNFLKIYAEKEDSGLLRGIYKYHGNFTERRAAMPFPRNFLDELIARNDIVDVVGSMYP